MCVCVYVCVHECKHVHEHKHEKGHDHVNLNKHLSKLKASSSFSAVAYLCSSLRLSKALYRENKGGGSISITAPTSMRSYIPSCIDDDDDDDDDGDRGNAISLKYLNTDTQESSLVQIAIFLAHTDDDDDGDDVIIIITLFKAAI